MSGEKMTKMSGYLEKRGKLSIMGRWKKWWCVLEGQLLLYYKSRIEYVNLSPCCGSLNMAFVQNVQPHVGFQIHIVTHTQIIILRTKNKEKQQQWFYALVGVLPQNSYLAPLLYLATNSIEYRRKSERRKKKPKHKVFEEPTTTETKHDESSSFVKSDSDFLNSAVKNDSNFSVFENHTTEIENISASQEKIQLCATKISTSVECKLPLPHNQTVKCSSEVNIRRYSSYHSVINGASVTERIANRRSISCECVFKEYLTSCVEQYNFLSTCSIRSSGRSQSNNLLTDDKKQKRNNRRKRRNDSKKYNTLSRKSLSFLGKIFKMKWESRNKQQVENNCPQDVEKKEHESRPMTPVESEINISESSASELEKINTIEMSMIETTENNVTARSEVEETTPCNDFVEQNTTNASSINEAESESSDTESGIVTAENTKNTQEDETVPDLPIKSGTRSSYVYNDFKDINSNYPTKITFRSDTDTNELISIDNSASMELDSLLLELTAMNNQRDKSHESLEFHNNFIDEDEEPDYDIPRPHTSLMSDTGSISNVHEKSQLNFPLNNGIPNQKYDSLSIDMAPDSLEMPWLTNDTNNCNLNYWSTKKEFNLCLENDSGSEYDYHDSLNSNKYNI